MPSFNCNLISIFKLTQDLNCRVTYTADFCHIQDQDSMRRIGSGELKNGVYVIKIPEEGNSLAEVGKDHTSLWHARLGHPSNKTLQHISTLFKCNFYFDKLSCCDICHKSKQCGHSFKHRNNKASEPFALIHCDLWGKYHTPTHNGSHFLPDYC